MTTETVTSNIRGLKLGNFEYRWVYSKLHGKIHRNIEYACLLSVMPSHLLYSSVPTR